MEPRDCTGEAWAAKARHALPPILGFTLAGSCSLLIEALLIWLALTFNAWYYATAVVWPMILCIMVYRKHWRSHIEHVVASRPDWQWKAAGMPAPAQSPHQQWEAKVLEKLVAGGVTLAQFSLEDLAVATQHFKHRIAISNQHRNLYMGVDPSTGQIIAVEQLPITAGPPEGRSWKEFQDRLTLCTVCPKYFLMVQLLGICVQGRLLVYQHMPNGSLEQWIFGQEGGMLLGWKQRMSIAVAMAKGLTQIHESRDTLMHLDITPENILLTDGFEPRLWVTRPVQLSRTIDLSQILLTKGYVAPEVLLHDIGFSHKSQVFSYGMVLLELVSGRRNRDDSVIYPECRYFPAWAQHCLNRETMDSTPAGLQGNRELAEELLDKRLQGAFVVEESLKLIKLGLWCIQRDPALRPEASTVLRMLEGQIEVSMPPLIPGFVEALKEAALSSCSSFRIASQRSSAWSSDLETEGTFFSLMASGGIGTLAVRTLPEERRSVAANDALRSKNLRVLASSSNFPRSPFSPWSSIGQFPVPKGLTVSMYPQDFLPARCPEHEYADAAWSGPSFLSRSGVTEVEETPENIPLCTSSGK